MDSRGRALRGPAIGAAIFVLIGAFLVLGFSGGSTPGTTIPNGGTAGGLAIVVAVATIVASSSNAVVSAVGAVIGIAACLEVRAILQTPIPPAADETEFGSIGLDFARGVLGVTLVIAVIVCAVCLIAVAAQVIQRRRSLRRAEPD